MLCYNQDVKSFLRKHFLEAFRYLRVSRGYTCLAGLVFIAGIMIGHLHPEHFMNFLESFRGIAESFRGKSEIQTIGMIFFRNISSSLFSVCGGILLGIPPLIAAFVNGALAGVVLSAGTTIGALKSIGLLFPHGIFELPAMMISWGIGIRNGSFFFKMEHDGTLGGRFKNSLRVFIFFIIPLLIIAAIIEGMSIAAKT